MINKKGISMLIRDWDVYLKQVLVRIDGNIPLTAEGAIQDDFRLKAILPTIQLLQEKGARITVITHLGRPHGIDMCLSTRPIQQWFLHHGYSSVSVQENLRFSEGEKNYDKDFARSLAQGMDFYVNDAWGVMHRKDTSITLVPELFSQGKRSYGLLVEKELQALHKLRSRPSKPYIVIIGGGKIETKLPYLFDLIQHQAPDMIFLLPAVSIPFSAVQNTEIGNSSCTQDQLEQAALFLKRTQEKNIRVILPQDYTYVRGDFYGAYDTCDVNSVPCDALLLGIGPKTLSLYEPYIRNAGTIFVNGACGLNWRPETMDSFRALLQLITLSKGYTVVGGGNSVAEVAELDLLDAFGFCSTGGGSTLAYISGDSLPGLEVLGVQEE